MSNLTLDDINQLQGMVDAKDRGLFYLTLYQKTRGIPGTRTPVTNMRKQ